MSNRLCTVPAMHAAFCDADRVQAEAKPLRDPAHNLGLVRRRVRRAIVEHPQFSR